MLEHRPHLIALRGYLVGVFLALLAGCIPEPSGESLIAAPTNVNAVGGNAAIAVTWSPSSGATGYNVKRATTNGGPYAQLAVATSAAYTDSSVTNGTAYYYVVSALDASGEGANSTQVTATPAAPTAPPAAPANVVATAGNAQVSVNWSASNGATAYRVKRATTGGGPYTQIASPTATSYVDTSLTNGTNYFYVVSAVNPVGESANSVQVSAIPAVMNPPPTTFGTWTDVTPVGVDLTGFLCSNYGTSSVQVDPANPSNLYAQFHCQGIWKSTDYGATWTGPINSGANGALAGDCSGSITIPPGSTSSVPVIYQSCIRGSAVGFWRSIDGGVNWARYAVTPGGARQDYTNVIVDPYDPNHLLMTGHEFDSIVESIDGGQNWTSVALTSGMLQNVLSGTIFFINTGTASTTRGTWLWLGSASNGSYGTWRTANAGAAWVQVDKNEVFGTQQIYQPDNAGVVYMAGVNSALGAGVLRSNNYGQTWIHVGPVSNQGVVFGTSKNVYSLSGFPIGAGGSLAPAFQVAAQPGTGTWVAPGTPAGMTQGPAQVSVVNDGTRNIFVGAMFNAGLWRYIEP